ncbi:cytochrome c3 family protein [Ferrimonas balearica]|uniref:cytochrome c3 family protein n=1 Tax=Ferrimonas balearica TaxID=44012 RepID=UPI001C993028|nr:cytochrome c3 family protein [Ferrimonas balearica]MBY5993584.1 nitrite reductase [Ferrimonas balearica]
MSKSLLLPVMALLALSGPAIASDESCLRCHKRNGTMEGVHGQIGANGLSCVRCHGEQDGHPRNKAALVYFGQDSKTPLAEQNAQCTTCHRDAKLREADWTHDVHRPVLPCASCHQLHPETDPMSTLDDAGRTQACVDCHSLLSEEGEQ